MRILIVLAAAVVLILVLRTLSRSSPQMMKVLLKGLAIWGGGALLLFLLVTGRMHWLFGLVAATIPFIGRLLPLLRFVPFLRSLYVKHKNSQRQNNNTSTGQHSTVQSKYLNMTLEHDSGEMNGVVLDGKYFQKQLSDLSLPQLLELLAEVQEDEESNALLQAYLDRTHADWRDKAQSTTQNKASTTPNSEMTPDEAREILGVNEQTTKEEIIVAHRKLMQKVHPDHGGSTYLAAKINLAKDKLVN